MLADTSMMSIFCQHMDSPASIALDYDWNLQVVSQCEF